MVKKYVILANSNDNRFDIPRQLLELNGEKLVARTIRLLKENGVKDITMTASDKRFEGLGAKIYTPDCNDYNYTTETGYWLNAFPYELMDEPVCFIWGDVYFSEEAIKTIVNTESQKNLFFCSYNNKSVEYIKHHDEPFAFKVMDPELFKKHIEICKKAKDDGTACREPVIWEVYRSMHGLDINKHVMAEDFVAINDISCDIDGARDLDKLKLKLDKKNKYKLTILTAYYKTYELVQNLMDTLVPQLTSEVEAILIDDGCNEKMLDKYSNKVKVIHLKENKGGAYAYNTGIIEAQGEYIAFVDSDDMISEDYVKTLLEAIDHYHTDTIFMDWQDMETGEVVHNPHNIAQWRCIYKRSIIPMFIDERRYSWNYPFYEELESKNYTRSDTNKVLYYYNSGNPNNLTHEKQKIIEKENQERRRNMVKVEVIEEFTFGRFNELKDIERLNKDTEGRLFVGDKFYCSKDIAEYLTGKNALNKVVVKVIEIIKENKETNLDQEKKTVKKPKKKQKI